jgi:RNA polymerase sigma-70 factor (ECF subfamily)
VPLVHHGKFELMALDLRSIEGSQRVDGVGALPTGSRAPEVFARQARQCLPRLYRIARRLTPQQADAEDLVHDTYLKALRAADRVRLGTTEDCRAWLTRILVNTFRDQYRQRLRSPIVSAAGAGIGELIELRPSPEPGPAERIEGKRFAEAAQAAIMDLPPELRLIVALFLVDGLTYEQIAERMAVPVGTVMSRLWRARRVLRQKLREHLPVGDKAALPPAARRASS